MTVKVLERTIKEYGFERIGSVTIKTDKHSVSLHELNECPEDAIFGRDLDIIYDIPTLLEEAYNAGKAGEPFEVVYEEEEDE